MQNGMGSSEWVGGAGEPGELTRGVQGGLGAGSWTGCETVDIDANPRHPPPGQKL